MQQRLLHVGCGGDSIPAWLSQYDEIRLDIDPSHNPHIVADMVSLGDIGPFDAVYCSHALEHLSPHDVPVALGEFIRVLAPNGAIILFVPDLEGVEANDEPLFDSPAGPIAGLDLIYGFRKMLKEKPYMAHKTGFVQSSLHKALIDAGFSQVIVNRLSDYALLGVGKK